MKNRGLFLSFEGSEGCGKSTQIASLRQELQSSGHNVVVLREPGGTPLGEEIRHLLKHAVSGEGMCPESELLLFSASRAQLVRQVIAPALATPGTVVLADRFVDSTTVYQGIARGIPADTITAINRLATNGVTPDTTFLLDLDVSESRTRLAARGETPDRLEREDDGFFQLVRNGYLELARSEPRRFHVLDASSPPESVQAAIRQHLRQRFHGLLP